MRSHVLLLAVASIGSTLVACGAAPTPATPNDVTPTGSAKSESAVRARADLDEGERSIDASTSECASACKALASMMRAQQALCDAEPRECDAAKARVEKAQAKIKGAGCACSAP